MIAKLSSVREQIHRWIKGHHFPPGFDDWYELIEPHPDLKPAFKAHDSFSTWERTRKIHSDVDSFIQSVTSEGNYWHQVNLDPSGTYVDRSFSLEFSHDNSDNTINTNNTHIWLLQISGNAKFFELTNLRVHNCLLNASSRKIRFNNCIIGNLDLAENARMDLQLSGCWVGTLKVPSHALTRLSVTDGGIARIACAPNERESPFAGAVSFKNVFFPHSPSQSRLFQDSQAYRTVYAHLKKLGNTLMADRMRACQLRSERTDEQGCFAKLTNWSYGTFSDYGMSSGRPVSWLLSGYILAFIYCYNFDTGTLAQPVDSLGHPYVGVYAHLLDENGGGWIRSLLLPLQSIINPFGSFSDSRKLIIPTTMLGSTLLTIQGLFSDMLLVMTALTIRRRFKTE